MGAQQAIFVADAAEPRDVIADPDRSEPHRQPAPEDSDDRLNIDSALELSDDAIRQRSQQIWEREGCPAGHEQDHWMRARAELAALMARTSNAQLTAPLCLEEVVAPSIPAGTIEPEATTPSAAAPAAPREVSDDDGVPAPNAPSRQDVTVSPTRDDFVAARPRPSRLPLTPRSPSTCVVPAIICAGIILRGELESAGDIQFDGTMEGDICCANLVVGDQAVIQGDVIANDVMVRGRIQGGIRARKVYLFSGSYVEGAIHYGALTIETGAELDGSFQRRDDLLELETVASSRTSAF
jgi:cytoskeletal protein CcmA (bactofilin family)